MFPLTADKSSRKRVHFYGLDSVISHKTTFISPTSTKHLYSTNGLTNRLHTVDGAEQWGKPSVQSGYCVLLTSYVRYARPTLIYTFGISD